jgi:hypothetical protein
MAEAEIKWFYRSQSKYCKIVLIDILQNAVKTAIVLNQMTLQSSITHNYNIAPTRLWQTYCKKKEIESVFIYR